MATLARKVSRQRPVAVIGKLSTFAAILSQVIEGRSLSEAGLGPKLNQYTKALCVPVCRGQVCW